MARATQQPHGIGKPLDVGIGLVTGGCEGERDMGWEGRLIALNNSPLGLGNQLP